MNNLFIAYNAKELERKTVLLEAQILAKSKIISKDQWDKIQVEFASDLYAPSIFMRVIFFILTIIGMLTTLGPISLLFLRYYQFFMLLTGIVSLGVVEIVLIKDKSHFKTGTTEALIYSGLAFVYFGLLGFDSPDPMVLAVAGFIFAGFAAIRYLDLIATLLAIGFFSWMIFQILLNIGGYAQAFIPFIFMILFALIFWLSKVAQKKLSKIYLTKHFILIKTISLILVYLAGNYFVVRELSVNMLNLELADNQDISFAFLFYGFTALIPLGYLYWGIKHKSRLFIRISLLTIALSVITFKYYFSLGMPVITVTVAGAVLISIALFFINYLKQTRNGFTREKLMHSDWNSPELIAVITSQTLGGNLIDQPVNDDFNGGQGGEFGGGGADGKW